MYRPVRGELVASFGGLAFENGPDVVDLRGIGRAHVALVIVRPDQHVADVLPPTAHDESSGFVTAFLRARRQRQSRAPLSQCETGMLEECRPLPGERVRAILSVSPWGYSSAGRALAWHARGQRFDPAYLHHSKLERQHVANRAAFPTAVSTKSKRHRPHRLEAQDITLSR